MLGKKNSQYSETRVANNVALFRLRSGLTVRQLAARAGLSASTVTRIETARIKSPAIRTLEALANELDVTFNELVWQDNTQEERR